MKLRVFLDGKPLATGATVELFIDGKRYDSPDSISFDTQQQPDVAKGEWRCNCPSRGTFDTSINPAYFRACARCGATRPS